MPSTLDAGRPESLQKRRLRTGALTFAAFTTLGLAGVFVAGAGRNGSAGVAGLRPGFLLLAVASAVLDLVLGASRYQLFLRKILPGCSFWLPLRADVAGRFVAAVTPSQGGGGPAQVFVLQRGGVPVPAALSFLLVNLLATLAFFLLAGGITAWRLREQFGSAGLRLLLQYGFTSVLAMFVLLLVALVRPDFVSRPVAFLARRIGPGDAGRPTALERAARWLTGSIEPYRAACDLFVRRSPLLPFASFAVTIAMYLNKFTLAWLVLRGLGGTSGLLPTIALMMLVHMGVFLAPSPGGSGIAEIATGAVMSSLMPGHLLGPFTLVYRLLSVYLPAAAGAAVFLVEIGRIRGREASLSGMPRGNAGRPAPRPWSKLGCRVTLGLVPALAGSAAATAAGDSRGSAEADWAAIAAAAEPCSCPLCDESAPRPTPLPRARAAAAAAALAASNRSELERIDGLLRAGRLGPPASDEARRRAHLMARLVLANWYSFLLPLVADPERVWAVSPDALEPVATRYSESVVIPLPRLRELRLGRGRACARYDLSGNAEDGVTTLGGRQLRYRVRDVAAGESHRRLLGIEWDAAEVLVGEHYGFRLTRSETTDAAGRVCDLYMALDVSGGWVRRFGVHRPAGFAFWATRSPSGESYLLPAPQVGSAIYIPGLRFHLPVFPDIDLDDVRALNLPMPLFDAADLRRGTLPSWLAVGAGLSLVSWKGWGPVPPALRAQFPDR